MMKLGQMMKEAAGLQQKLQEMQDRLLDLEVEGVAGAGMVRVVADGKGRVKQVALDDAILTEEKSMLEDLLAAAVNDAKDKAEAKAAEELQKAAGGLSLPPGFLPGT